MKLLGLLLGAVFGAAEFFVTKAMTDKAMAGKVPVVWVLVKIASYAAVLLPVFFLAQRDFAVRFGIGAGAGLLAAGLLFFAYKVILEKR